MNIFIIIFNWHPDFFLLSVALNGRDVADDEALRATALVEWRDRG